MSSVSRSSSSMSRSLPSTAPSSVPSSPTLFQHDLHDLHDFSSRRRHFDDFTNQLRVLPPIAPYAEPLTVTRVELETWLAEQARIEQEVEDFDKGDLDKWRALAKAASHRDMSASDTDLIELVLQTLLSLDKLMGLLRQRGKLLHLLQLRMRWHEHLKATEQAQDALKQTVQQFAKKARWTKPATPPLLVSRSWHSSVGTEGDTSSGSPLRSNGLPRSPRGSTTASIASNSAMSRTMRSEILALDLSRHHRSITALSKTTVAKAGQVLDELIDASPTPVPESFLDAQETLENTVEATTVGLSSCLTALANQWRAADEVFWTGHAAQQEAIVLIRDVEAALLIQPDLATAAEFEEDLAGIRQAVEVLSNEAIPTPSHAVLPDQRDANETLKKVLDRAIADAKKTLAKAEAVVRRYADGARALERNRVLRRDIEASVRTEHRLLKQLRDLEESSAFTDDAARQGFLAQGADDYLARLDSTTRAIGDRTATIGQIEREVAEVLVELGQTGIDPNVRSELKQAHAGLQNLVSQTADLLARERARRAALDLVREAWSRLQQFEQALAAGGDDLAVQVPRSAWTSDGTACTNIELGPLPRQTDLDAIQQDIQAFPPLAAAYATLLMTELDERRLRMAAQTSLYELHRDLLAQAQAVRYVDDEAAALSGQLLAVKERCAGVIAGPAADFAPAAVDAEVASLTDAVAALDRSLPSTIPFVASDARRAVLSSTGPPLATLDLVEIDQRVRNHVNSTSAVLSRQLQDAKSYRAAVDIASAGAELIYSVSDLQRELDSAAAQIDLLRTQMERKEEHTSLADFEALRVQLHALVLPDAARLSAAQHGADDVCERCLANGDASEPLLPSIRASQATLGELAVRLVAVQAIVKELDHALNGAVDVRRSQEERRQAEKEWQRVEAEERTNAARRRREAVDAAASDLQAELDQVMLLQHYARADIDAVLDDISAAGATARLHIADEASSATEEQLSALSDHYRSLHEDVERDGIVDLENVNALPHSLSRAVAQQNELRQLVERGRDLLAAHQHVAEELVSSSLPLPQSPTVPASTVSQQPLQPVLAIQQDAPTSIRPPSPANLDLGDQAVVELAEAATVRPPVGTPPPASPASTPSSLLPDPNSLAHQNGIRTPAPGVAGSQVGEAGDHANRAVKPAANGDMPAPALGPVSSSAAALSSSQKGVPIAVDDLFGSTSSASRSTTSNGIAAPRVNILAASMPADAVQREASELRSLLLGHLEPARGADADLPTATIAQEARRRLGSLVTRSGEDAPAVPALRQQVARVGSLADFGACASGCDERFSDLLDAIDAASPQTARGLQRSASSRSLALDAPSATSPAHGVRDALDDARAAYITARTLAEQVADDERVATRLLSLEQTWIELSQLAEEPTPRSQSPPAPSMIPTLTRSTSKASLSSVLATPTEVMSQVLTSRLPVKSPSRQASKRYSTVSTSSSYTSSSRPPSRNSVRSMGQPAARQQAQQQSLGVGRPQSLYGASKATTQRASITSRQASSSASSLRRVSSSQSLGTVRKPSRYHANPKRQLDVEVGRIVNALPVLVPIMAAQVDTNGATTGSYWIGEPEPRLYYCRILRSQTVMLRVGGGWQELGQFLRKHFAHLFTLPKSTSAGSETWLTADSVRAAMADGAEISPIRSLSMSRSTSSSRFAQLAISSSPASSGKRRSLGPLDQNLPPFMKRVESGGSIVEGSPKRVSVPWR